MVDLTATRIATVFQGEFDSPLSPRPLSHVAQFCDPIFNADQGNAGRQQNMGIGRWSRVGCSLFTNTIGCSHAWTGSSTRVELGLKRRLVVLVAMCWSPVEQFSPKKIDV